MNIVVMSYVFYSSNSQFRLLEFLENLNSRFISKQFSIKEISLKYYFGKRGLLKIIGASENVTMYRNIF